MVTNRSFDAVTGWLGTAQSGIGGGSGVKNLGFLFDEMGNVTERQDNNLGLTENIYYDNDYRFSYSKLNGTQNLSVSYDGKGNITSRSDVASGATWTYGSTQIHAVTQAGSGAYAYAYDANGNAISRQGDSITWSTYNYPTTVNAGSGSTAETVSFNYGPDRRRWQQSYSGNSTTEITSYVGELLEVATSGGVTNYRHYINAGGENIAVYSRQSNGTNTFDYVLSDHQASVASITNSSGGVVVGESFTAFGNRRNPSTWSGAASNSDLTTAAGITRQGYTFQTQLGLWMGMNHMNGRVEDAITGRMLSADPHIPGKANPQSYNRYTYVNNNPVTYGDPTGFTPCGSHCQSPNPVCARWWEQCDGPYVRSPANSPAGLGEGGVDWNAIGAGAGAGSYNGSTPMMAMQLQDGGGSSPASGSEFDQNAGGGDQPQSGSPTPGFDPVTGDLTPAAQSALDTWVNATQDVFKDIQDGNYVKQNADEQFADWAALNWLYTIGQSPFPGAPPTPPPPPLPPPELSPVPPIEAPPIT
jgi:RHS repeat-associated protein